RSRPTDAPPGSAGQATPVAAAEARRRDRPAAVAAPAIPPSARTPAGHGSGARCGREPLPRKPRNLSNSAQHHPTEPTPRSTSEDRHVAHAANSQPCIRPSHPAGPYNLHRPRPTPVCCLENSKSARSVVCLLPLSWEKNLFLRVRDRLDAGGADEIVHRQSADVV